MSDPYFSNVTLLACNESGTNGGTTFIDQSNYARTLTASGAAQWSNTSPPTGLTTTLNCAGGSTDFVSAADAAELSLVGADFTIEVWFYAVDASAETIISKVNSSNFEWEIVNISGSVLFYASSDGTTQDIAAAQSVGSISQNTWYHMEIDRSGSNWYGFLDGVQGFTFSSSASIYDGTSTVNMGARADAVLGCNGRIASARITKGVARHTANFTRPALPLELGASNLAALAWVKA